MFILVFLFTSRKAFYRYLEGFNHLIIQGELVLLFKATKEKILDRFKWSNMIFCNAFNFLKVLRQLFLQLRFAVFLNRQPAAFVWPIIGMALVYQATGKKKEADDALKDFTDRFQNDWSYLLAELYAYRGEKDKAFLWLENAYIKKDGWLVFLKGDPLLKNLNGDNRYKAFMKKMNLTFD